MADPGGLEPPAAGLKVPCPADPGFTLGVQSKGLAAAASRPRLRNVVMVISFDVGGLDVDRLMWWTRTVTIRGLPVICRRLCH
jgi:hypothetical protein